MNNHIRDHHTTAGKFLFFIKEKLVGPNLADAAIHITELVKSALSSFAFDVLVGFTQTDIDDKALEALRKELPLILANELLLKDINADSTPEDITLISKQILQAFGALSDDKKEQFYTTVSTLVLQLLERVKNGEHITFGEGASLVEKAWQEYQRIKKS